MKYLLLSIITILAVSLSEPNKELEYDSSVDSLLAKTNNTFKQASTVCVKAEKQQANDNGSKGKGSYVRKRKRRITGYTNRN